jgi:hypothetical protein
MSAMDKQQVKPTNAEIAAAMKINETYVGRVLRHSAGARRCRADSGWTTAARNNTGPDDVVRDVDGAAEDINRLLTTFAGLS